MKKFAAWWLAMRPKTLSVSVVPVLVGTALAYFERGTFVWWPALAALLAAMLIQIGTNLYNDVGDFERGADTAERLGPPRATAQGWLSARAVRRGAQVVFVLALLIGLALAAWGGWPIVLIGILSLISGWAYTGGRWPIAYSPLGELFVMVFFGVVAVSGTYYLQTFSVSKAALIAGVMLGSFAAAVITVNNTRDIHADAKAHKRTLAVRLGRRAMNAVYAFELMLPFALLPWLALQTHTGVWMALPALAGVFAVTLYRRFCAAEGVVFNALLAATAKLQLIFALLLVGTLLFQAISF